MKHPLGLASVVFGTIIIALVTRMAFRRVGNRRWLSILVLLVGLFKAGSLWLDAHFLPNWNPIMAVVDVSSLVLGFVLVSLIAPRSTRQGLLIGLGIFLVLPGLTRYFPILKPYVNSPGSFATAGWLMALIGRPFRREETDEMAGPETRPCIKSPDDLLWKP